MTLEHIEKTLVGGAAVARLDLMETARLMLDLAQAPARPEGPLYFTSVNGEVLARRFFDKGFARLIDSADSIAADGQPLVTASHLFSRNPLPERVATTDLYPLVALMAQQTGASFYLLGASEEINRAAFEATRRAAPNLRILGRSHGFLTGRRLEEKLDEINALAPDILWLAMGVPLEQQFVRDHAHRLKNVKIIKTSGGLFDFVAGAKKRAPEWMQRGGFEWAFRLALEPRRLARRYLTTNPVAAFLLLTQTR
ncbi:WecB/TagA/CpsF family glycosyltransferase [Methylocystis sp. IM3]|uniref:WecB/TagA/CpsF family glycosyltransferase n=2 Tax=Methylocystis TaxID=133 RepID=UPI0026B6709A